MPVVVPYHRVEGLSDDAKESAALRLATNHPSSSLRAPSICQHHLAFNLAMNVYVRRNVCLNCGPSSCSVKRLRRKSEAPQDHNVVSVDG